MPSKIKSLLMKKNASLIYGFKTRDQANTPSTEALESF
jgi:hypothetical protein